MQRPQKTLDTLGTHVYLERAKKVTVRFGYSQVGRCQTPNIHCPEPINNWEAVMWTKGTYEVDDILHGLTTDFDLGLEEGCGLNV